MRLKDKVAIVTGSASEIGIGRAIAVLFSREGASVTVADIDAAGAQKTADHVNQLGGRAIASTTDISDSESVDAMMRATVQAFGALHILVNNAAYIKDEHSVTELTEEQWTRSIDVTLKGTFLCSKYAIPLMIEAGGGTIVNISSVGGVVGFRGNAAYCSAKGGVIQLTRSLAIDYGLQRIRANAICPGPIETAITPTGNPVEDAEMLERHIQMTVLGRRGKPEEVAYAALFLASDESSYVTGAALTVDGGWTVR